MSVTSVCRSCGHGPLEPILDLGDQPVANELVPPAEAGEPHGAYPLAVALCGACALLQVTENVSPRRLFGHDYPYYSSFSPFLLDHSRRHALDLIQRRGLGRDSLVVEVGSNDGYLLKNFVEAGIPVQGVDPCSGPASAAVAQGVPTILRFFEVGLARELVETRGQADVIIGNNVLAHVHGINGFVEGLSTLLKPDGVLVCEFPYVVDLIESCAFDTIYHEHVFYYSLASVQPLFARHGLHLNDVQRLDIHGGSLRLTASKRPGRSAALARLLDDEERRGVAKAEFYTGFGERVALLRDELRGLLGSMRQEGKRIAAYGAAAKGATLLNFCGIDGRLIDYVVDRNHHKVGLCMPGSNLPIRPVETLQDDQPDYLLLLAWNFATEIMEQQREFERQGGRFIVPVPRPMVCSGMSQLAHMAHAGAEDERMRPANAAALRYARKA